MPTPSIYLYGMTVLSTIHRLKDKYPPADGYQEIVETIELPGGEAGNAAIVLSNLGLGVRLDGCWLGERTAGALVTHFTQHRVDVSLLTTHADFPGWRDIVLCDGKSRTVFGWFVQYLFGTQALWNEPDEASIRDATCVGLDPFFGAASQRVAELCVTHGRPYVTIDCRHDGFIAQHAQAIVCSREFLDREYAGQDRAALLEQYRASCPGLVIFTFGGTEILYSPTTGGQVRLTPYDVPVVDTLGAGDTFRAGVIYGVVKQMSEADTVRFAAACAAVSCTRFPSVQVPPTRDEIETLMRAQPR